MASRFEAEKFTGKNDYGLWKMKMRAVLIQQGLAGALVSADSGARGKEVLDDKAQLKQVEMLQKAHSAVILCLSDNVLREVSKEKTAADILAKLDSLYLTKSLANRLYMKQRLYAYKFVEERSISEQLEDFNKAVDDLEGIDVTIDDEDKAILMLNALPRSYDQLRDAMLYGREKSITLSEIQAALRAKELQLGASKHQELPAESLNIKRFKGKKFKKKQEFSKPETSGTKETRTCHWCKKPGHLKRDCFAWKKKQASESQPHSNVVCDDSEGAPEILNVMEVNEKGIWIMDSGASFHMCPNFEWFQDLTVTDGSVLLGNDQVCKIRGIGSVKLRMHDGSTKLLSGVRLIPEVKRNLISLGSLEQKGYSFASSDGRMEVKKGSDVKMLAERKGNLYYLIANVIVGDVNLTTGSDLKLWHLRLGHPAEGSVKELMKRGLVTGDHNQKMATCEDCLMGKAKKLSYPTGKHHSDSPLAYAHSDLWGPAPVKTLGGGRYYMSIIDDFSRKVWVYILREKSDALRMFKIWCKEVELEKGSSLKCLRTDNGLEYLSKEFDDFCGDKGMKRHKTVPANPQQNGVAERMNRTLLERVRCMILSSGVGKNFWGEAVSTAAFLINKCPSSAINGEIPDEKWYGNKCDYSRLRPFGCKAFAHTKQSKLDARAMRCLMLGYPKGVKGYRLWCTEPGNKKVIISRDVVFLESQMPCLTVNASSTEMVQKATDQFEVEPDPGPAMVDGADSEMNDELGGQSEVHSQETNDLADYQLARDRTRRTNIRPPSRFADSEMLFFALNVAEQLEHSEPASYSDAINGPEKEQWIKAMREEIESLIRNKTWILVDKAEFRGVTSCKWVYKKKIEKV